MDDAAGPFCGAPVVVAVPEYGPWLVAPVTWLLRTGGIGAVSVGAEASTWLSVPKTVDTALPGYPVPKEADVTEDNSDEYCELAAEYCAGPAPVGVELA